MIERNELQIVTYKNRDPDIMLMTMKWNTLNLV